jgi:predicted AlkP superfamily pyrophosphatase or phosphodiesterase
MTAIRLFLLLFAVSLRAAPPKLVAVIVVDQMRADYVADAPQRFQGGFARLVRDGAVFSQARHGHVPTQTPPGHAALSTGRFPREHGIVGLSWWDHELNAWRPALVDSKGRTSPESIMVDTLGDALKESSPRSEVVSISGKDRGAVLMGGKRANLVLWYDEGSGAFVTSPYYPRLPGWVKGWDRDNQVQADRRKSIHWDINFDQLTLSLARRAVEEEGLGEHKSADLLLISLSGTDLVGHRWGPDAPQMSRQLQSLDRELGSFLDFLDRMVGADGYTAVLSSDHGVLPTPESERGKAMGARRVQRKDFEARVGKLLAQALGAPPAAGSWVGTVSAPHVYLNYRLAKERGVDLARLRREAVTALESQDEVAKAYLPEDLLARPVSSGTYDEVFRRSVYPGRSGDVLVLLKPGVFLADDETSTGHSTPYDYDSRVPMIFLGAGIRPGSYDGPILTTCLAPTLGRLLEIPFAPGADSRVLEEALAQPHSTGGQE